jgi:hypothetical protein
MWFDPPGAAWMEDAWHGRPAGRSKVVQERPADHLLSVPAWRRRTPHSAFAMTSASSTAEDTPSTGTAPAWPACPGRSRASSPAGRLAPRMLSLPHGSPLSHSFVRPAPRAFFRPDRGSSRAPRADCVKAGPVQGPPQGLALTRSSTARGSARRASAAWRGPPLEHRPVRHEAVLEVTPERHEELARERDDGRFARAPAHRGEPALPPA